ncbi:hypothetical protein DFQ27_003233 [Actinomortierella ambigua]|uniref:RING-type domain-containing protein n=1 Tax=Actinomortierella ambigua TaxID=1343610 RepID=A0A9P6Q848_9FUNG|nr:hypothetical protein DFQ27_003233 [Actinomortierella ambigua]
MNANAPSFVPQGNGNDRQGGGRSGFSSASVDVKRGNQKSGLQQKTFVADSQQQQRLRPPTAGKGKNHRNSGQGSQRKNTTFDGHERENRNPSSRLASPLSTASTDSLSSSVQQLSLGGGGAAGNGNTKNTKKNQVSLNHLLNFSFPVREEPQIMGPVRRRRNANYQPFDKERFINANFRFLVNPKSDYTPSMVDPDVRIRWEDIEQVLISVQQACPICLQPPVAARITKCGHVYCFSCVLHYLALNDTNKNWRKCPICWDAIYEKDLKSVRPIHEDPHCIADQGEKEIAKQLAAHKDVWINMRLVFRSLNSTLALPRSASFPIADSVLPAHLQGQPPLSFYPDALHFSRLMLTSMERIDTELERDLRDIEFSMEESKSYGATHNSEEVVFLEMAREKIRQRQQDLAEESKLRPKSILDRERLLRQHLEQLGKQHQGKGQEQGQEQQQQQQQVQQEQPKDSFTPMTVSQDDETTEDGRVAIEMSEAEKEEHARMVAEQDPESMHDAFRREHEGQDDQPNDAGETRQLSEHGQQAAATEKKKRVPNGATPSTTFFFYQAANGLHLYLQPLDIRILRQHFESYDKFPDEIRAKVLDIEETSLTEEVRKKCKYLGHLPLGCEVSFLHVALEEVVSEESLKPFVHELKQRRTRQREKEAREERERVERERRLNPRLLSSQRREEIIANDPFFQVERRPSLDPSSRSNNVVMDAGMREALRVAGQARLEEEMPTLSEANAMVANGATRSRGQAAAATGAGTGAGAQSQEISSSRPASSGAGATVWGTPVVPTSHRHYEDESDDYGDDYDYEPDIVVKRGKKKVLLLSNNTRRSGR